MSRKTRKITEPTFFEGMSQRCVWWAEERCAAISNEVSIDLMADNIMCLNGGQTKRPKAIRRVFVALGNNFSTLVMSNSCGRRCKNSSATIVTEVSG
jgi:hypothetical protein